MRHQYDREEEGKLDDNGKVERCTEAEMDKEEAAGMVKRGKQCTFSVLQKDRYKCESASLEDNINLKEIKRERNKSQKIEVALS